MNIDSSFEQWRLKHMRGTAASKDIMELLALAFAGGRAVSKPWVGLTDEEIAQTVGSPLDEVYLVDFRRVIEKLKEKNGG